MTKEDKKNEDDAASAGATFGVLLGGILWWNDIVGLWGAFAIMIVIPLFVGASCPKKKNIAKQRELKEQEQRARKEQKQKALTALKWGLKWGIGTSAFLMLVGMLSGNGEIPLWITFISFVLFAAFVGLSLALIRLIWEKIKETINTNKKEKEIVVHFESMPKPKRKVHGEKPTEDDDFDLPGYGVAIWESSEGVPINFNYVRADGKYTERTVIIHKMTKDSKTRFYFQGYCLLRKATRTFNSENIQDIYDMNGEIIEVPEFVNRLAGYDAYGSTEVKSVKNRR